MFELWSPMKTVISNFRHVSFQTRRRRLIAKNDEEVISRAASEAGETSSETYSGTNVPAELALQLAALRESLSLSGKKTDIGKNKQKIPRGKLEVQLLFITASA